MQHYTRRELLMEQPGRHRHLQRCRCRVRGQYVRINMQHDKFLLVGRRLRELCRSIDAVQRFQREPDILLDAFRVHTQRHGLSPECRCMFATRIIRMSGEPYLLVESGHDSLQLLPGNTAVPARMLVHNRHGGNTGRLRLGVGLQLSISRFLRTGFRLLTTRIGCRRVQS